MYDGRDVFEMGAEYRDILGYLPQEFGFYPDFTVREYLKYIASIKGISRGAVLRRVNEVVSLTGLEKLQYRKMKKLSGGMKRRAGIAQAILNDPKVLVLDEPTAGLDPKERIRFRNLISELSRDKIILLSTHIVSDVEYTAKEIMLMKRGNMLDAGSPADVIKGAGQRVWTMRMPVTMVENYMKSHRIVNIKSVGTEAELRILSGVSPAPDAREEQLNLEDVFLHYFGRKEGDEDDRI